MPGGLLPLRTPPGPMADYCPGITPVAPEDRKRGRPRDTWIRGVMDAALKLAGSKETLGTYIAAPRVWQAKVSAYCRNLP